MLKVVVRIGKIAEEEGPEGEYERCCERVSEAVGLGVKACWSSGSRLSGSCCKARKPPLCSPLESEQDEGCCETGR